MNNRPSAAVSLVHEQRTTKGVLEAQKEMSFAEVFKAITPRLVAVAEGLAQEVICELTGGVREALRGAGSHDRLEPVVIRIGDLKLDLVRRLLWRGDDEIHLSPKEFDLPLVHDEELRRCSSSCEAVALSLGP